MKISKHFLMLTVTLSGLFFAKAQTADEIITKYVDAIGGKEKVSTVTSVKMDNTMNIMGTDAPSVTTMLIGKGFRNETEFNGQKIVRVITDKGGWAVNPMAGGTDPEPISDDEYKAAKDQLYFTPFIDYAAAGGKVELAGKEKVGDADAYKINFTNKDNTTTAYYFDANNYTLLKTVAKAFAMGQEVEVTSTFSDYKKSDFGVTVPYSTNVDFGQFQIGLKVNKVDFNVPVDPSIFDMKK